MSSRTGRPPVQVTPEQIANVRRLSTTGIDRATIAARLSIPISRVRKILKGVYDGRQRLVQFCQTCRATVFMPCLACALRNADPAELPPDLPESVPVEERARLQLAIAELCLEDRIVGLLEGVGVFTVYQLLHMERGQLERMPIGKAGVERILQCLKDLGFASIDASGVTEASTSTTTSEETSSDDSGSKQPAT